MKRAPTWGTQAGPRCLAICTIPTLPHHVVASRTLPAVCRGVSPDESPDAWEKEKAYGIGGRSRSRVTSQILLRAPAPVCAHSLFVDLADGLMPSTAVCRNLCGGGLNVWRRRGLVGDHATNFGFSGVAPQSTQGKR